MGSPLKIDHAELLKLIHYDPQTGAFYRLYKEPRPGNPTRRKTGCLDGSNGYIRIQVNAGTYYGHRLAVFYMTGAWPPKEVDHINRDRSDNRWENLRCATKAQNMMNTAHKRPGLHKGVTFSSQRRKWAVHIGRKAFGRYEVYEDAVAAYQRAARELYGEFFTP